MSDERDFVIEHIRGGREAVTREQDNIERVEWTLEDPAWVPSREYLTKILAAYKELQTKNEHIRDELADWRKEGEKLRAVIAARDERCNRLETENERLKNEQMPMRLENEKLKAERHTTKQMLEDVLNKYGVGSKTPHYGLGRGGLKE